MSLPPHSAGAPSPPSPAWQTDLLRRMVEIDSPSGAEGPLAAFLAAEMADRGWRTQVDEVGNFVAERGAADRALLVFLGHIDTVTGAIPVRVEDGVLHGRGAVDAKGPLAAFLAAATEARLPEGLGVVCVGAVEEETSTSRGARHVVDRLRPDFLIIGEPSGWDTLCLGYKGNCHLRLTVRRPRSHGASGVPSAGSALCRFWADVLDAAERQRQGDKTIQRVTVDVTALRTDTDGLNETATIRLDVRTPPGVDIDQFRADLAAATPEDGVLEVLENLPPVKAGKQGPLVRELRKAIRAAGGAGGFSFKTGTSDMNIVGPAWRCPMVAYGPGDSALDHCPDERIVLDEYRQAVAVLRAALENLI